MPLCRGRPRRLRPSGRPVVPGSGPAQCAHAQALMATEVRMSRPSRSARSTATMVSSVAPGPVTMAASAPSASAHTATWSGRP